MSCFAAPTRWAAKSVVQSACWLHHACQVSCMPCSPNLHSAGSVPVTDSLPAASCCVNVSAMLCYVNVSANAALHDPHSGRLPTFAIHACQLQHAEGTCGESCPPLSAQWVVEPAACNQLAGCVGVAEILREAGSTSNSCRMPTAAGTAFTNGRHCEGCHAASRCCPSWT